MQRIATSGLLNRVLTGLGVRVDSYYLAVLVHVTPSNRYWLYLSTRVKPRHLSAHSFRKVLERNQITLSLEKSIFCYNKISKALSGPSFRKLFSKALSKLKLFEDTGLPLLGCRRKHIPELYELYTACSRSVNASYGRGWACSCESILH